MSTGTNETDHRRADRLLAIQQLDSLAESIEGEGGELAGAIIRAAASHLQTAHRRIEDLQTELASLRAGTTAAAPLLCLKHRYGADGTCAKCGADRQRRRKGDPSKSGLLRSAVERGVREGVTDSATIVEDGAAS